MANAATPGIHWRNKSAHRSYLRKYSCLYTLCRASCHAAARNGNDALLCLAHNETATYRARRLRLGCAPLLFLHVHRLRAYLKEERHHKPAKTAYRCSTRAHYLAPNANACEDRHVVTLRGARVLRRRHVKRRTRGADATFCYTSLPRPSTSATLARTTCRQAKKILHLYLNARIHAYLSPPSTHLLSRSALLSWRAITTTTPTMLGGAVANVRGREEEVAGMCRSRMKARRKKEARGRQHHLSPRLWISPRTQLLLHYLLPHHSRRRLPHLEEWRLLLYAFHLRLPHLRAPHLPCTRLRRA